MIKGLTKTQRKALNTLMDIATKLDEPLKIKVNGREHIIYSLSNVPEEVLEKNIVKIGK